jgi:site-specific recombinase XerD
MKKIPTYRVTRQLPPTLSTDEVLKLLESSSDTTTQGLRDRAMLEVLYSAALNVDEVTKLQIGDVTFTKSGVRLTIRKREKSKNNREVFVDQHTAGTLKDFIASVLNNSKYAGVWAEQKPNKPMFFNKFGNAVSPRCVRRTVEKYARTALLRDDISPKTLRLSRGVHLTIDGWTPDQIMNFIGHRSRTGTTTYQKIIDASRTSKRAAVSSPQTT